MAISEKIIKNFESHLDDFDPKVRKEYLILLTAFVNQGELAIKPEQELCNLHCHTFFSYNGYGYSPTHLAWLAKKNGLKTMGIVDFDVLDGVDEFFTACDFLGMRACAGMETRVFIPEFAEIEINSPGEPGVCYHMGIGFTSSTYLLRDLRFWQIFALGQQREITLFWKRSMNFCFP